MTAIIEFIRASLRLTTLLLLPALGGAYMNVAGVPNVGMEGMMLITALVSYIVSFTTGSWLLGLIAAILTGMLVGAVYALFVLRWKADIFAVGITLNVLMSGVCAYIIRRYYNQESMLIVQDIKLFPHISLSFLESHPHLYLLLSDYSFLIPSSILLTFVTYIVLFHTPLGFWLRAAGSNSSALMVSGKNVNNIRFIAFMISSAFCGLAGAHLSLGYLGMFALSLVAGRGFVALAIVLFGNSNPVAIIIASLIFGIAESAKLRIPTEVLAPQFPLMLPYILTILAISIMGKYSKSLIQND